MFKMATEATARAFFSQPYFAVVGASNDPAKFGHKSKEKLHLFIFIQESQFN
jgi:acyl-CoA synthetase (NDP forming)